METNNKEIETKNKKIETKNKEIATYYKEIEEDAKQECEQNEQNCIQLYQIMEQKLKEIKVENELKLDPETDESGKIKSSEIQSIKNEFLRNQLYQS